MSVGWHYLPWCRCCVRGLKVRCILLKVMLFFFAAPAFESSSKEDVFCCLSSFGRGFLTKEMANHGESCEWILTRYFGIFSVLYCTVFGGQTQWAIVVAHCGSPCLFWNRQDTASYVILTRRTKGALGGGGVVLKHGIFK